MGDEKLTLEERLAKVERELAIVGAPRPPVGLGSAPGGILAHASEDAGWLKSGLGAVGDPTSIAPDVYALLALGSPRLALARALGVPFNPYLINVRADFTSTDTSIVPDVGSDVKIVQDTLMDAMVVRVSNQSNVANLSVFQAQSDYFYNFQSGFEAILSVQGAPRYDVAPRYTPLSTMADVVVGNAHWPCGWLLTYQQQLFMSFKPTIALPYAPIEIVCTFRARVPSGEAFVDLTNRDAIAALAQKCGIVVSDAYRDRTLTGLINLRLT
jgi:hypothetical protein